MSDALTVEDLRWAEGAALKRVVDLRSALEMTHTRHAEAREWTTNAMVIRYQATAARFRAAAEAAEREEKRDGRDLAANDEHPASKS